MEPIFARYAVRYARKGFPVFPLAPLSKKPLRGKHGLSEATIDERQIAEWGRECPDSNIGLLTGPESFNVVDIDPDNGGFDTEQMLREEDKLWPDTPMQLTRSGGRHILLQHHDLIITGTDRLGPGIDFRGAGGYIVAAPSIVRDPETGHIGKYSWLCWPKTGIAPAPDWMIELLTFEAARREAEAQDRAQNTVAVNPANVSNRERIRYEGSARSTLKRLISKLSSSKEGWRGKTLYTCAGWMKPYIQNEFIEEIKVRDEFEAACKTNGLLAKNGPKDIKRTIDRAFEYSTSQLPDLSKLGDRPYERVT